MTEAEEILDGLGVDFDYDPDPLGAWELILLILSSWAIIGLLVWFGLWRFYPGLWT